MRARLMVITLASLVLAGCGTSASTAPSAGAPSTSQTPSASPSRSLTAAAWAGEVCVARDRLESTLRSVASSVTAEAIAAGGVTDALMRELEANSTELDAAASDLGGALGRAPIDVEDAIAGVGEIQQAGDDFAAARVAAAASLQSLGEANGVVAVGRAATEAVQAAKEVFDSGIAYVKAVDSASSSTRQELRAGFDAAPECR